MKNIPFISAFRDPAPVRGLVARIHEQAKPLAKATFMEVCGTHTMSLYRHGIRSLLPKHVKMMYGPGLWFYVESDGTLLFCEKEGQNAGVSGMIRHYPGRDMSLVLLCNMESAAWKPVWQIHERIADGQVES